MPGTARSDGNSIEPMGDASTGPGGVSGEVLGEGAAVPGACERRTVPTGAEQSRTTGPRRSRSPSRPRPSKPTRSDRSRMPGIRRVAVAHLGFAELASRAAPRHECDPARLHQRLSPAGRGCGAIHVSPSGARGSHATMRGRCAGSRSATPLTSAPLAPGFPRLGLQLQATRPRKGSLRGAGSSLAASESIGLRT